MLFRWRTSEFGDIWTDVSNTEVIWSLTFNVAKVVRAIMPIFRSRMRTNMHLIRIC
jgi:hypothetical protein